MTIDKTAWTKAWRIFEITPDGPATLFHTWEGSRVLPLDRPLKAKQGLVSNPGKSHYKFRAGWHIALSKKDAIEYLKRFTANRELCVCQVAIRYERKKPRSNAPVYLAKEMMVLKECWEDATSELSDEK